MREGTHPVYESAYTRWLRDDVGLVPVHRDGVLIGWTLPDRLNEAMRKWCPTCKRRTDGLAYCLHCGTHQI